MSSTIARFVGGICVVVTAFLGGYFFGRISKPALDSVAVADDRSATSGVRVCDAANRVQLTRPFVSWGGFAYDAALPAYAEVADTNDAHTRSKLVLCEDGEPLGPAHSLHADVVSKGLGRYSHWRTGVVFSASDNSDPNKNNRTYSVIPNKDEVVK